MTGNTIPAVPRSYAEEDPLLLGRDEEKSKTYHAGGAEVDDTRVPQSEQFNESSGRSSPCLPIWAIVLIAFLSLGAVAGATAGVIVAVNHARSNGKGNGGGNGAFTPTHIDAAQYYAHERTNGQTVRQIVANLRGILNANAPSNTARIVYLAGDSWMDVSPFVDTANDKMQNKLPNTYDKFMPYLKPDIMYYLSKLFHDSTAGDSSSTQCVMAAQAGSTLRDRSVPGGPNNPANDVAIRDTVTEHDRIVVHVSGNDLHQSILQQVLLGKSRQAIISGLLGGSLKREFIDAYRTLWRENFPRYLKFLTEKKKPKDIIVLSLPRTRAGYFRGHIANAVGSTFLASTGTYIVNQFYLSLLREGFPVLTDTLNEIQNGNPELQGIRITTLTTNDVLRGDETPDLYNQHDNLHPNSRGSEVLARKLYDHITTSPP